MTHIYFIYKWYCFGELLLKLADCCTMCLKFGEKLFFVFFALHVPYLNQEYFSSQVIANIRVYSMQYYSTVSHHPLFSAVHLYSKKPLLPFSTPPLPAVINFESRQYCNYRRHDRPCLPPRLPSYLPTCLPVCLPALLLTCLPVYLPRCVFDYQLAQLLTCLPAKLALSRFVSYCQSAYCSFLPAYLTVQLLYLSTCLPSCPLFFRLSSCLSACLPVGTELLIPKNNTAPLAAEQVANLC